MAITSLNGLVPLRQYVQEFNSSGTWVCPFGTTQVELLLVGGGGGGGSATAVNANHMAAGGGGGGGEVKKTSVAVTAGTTYTVTVGAGGSGSTATTAAGGSGGDSSFGLTRTIANAHWYNHEYAIHLASFSTMSTNTAAFTQPGGWFQKYQASGYSLASPPAYTLTNTTNPTMAYSITGIGGSAAALTAAGVPSGWNGYSYVTNGAASLTSYTDLCNWVPVTASTQYTASASVYAIGSPSTAIRIEWYQAFQGTFISASTSTTSTANNVWTQQTVTATSPANATFALVRYQCLGNGSNSPYAFWVNQQFEQGASVTSYKGPFTSKTWTQTGISNVITGDVASGGGGGSSVNPNGTGTVAGIGGGSASFDTGGGNRLVIGGAGSGMGSPVVMSTYRGGFNIQTGYAVQPQSAVQVPPAHPVTGRGGSGSGWNWNNSTPYLSAGAASYGVDGYGAGGAGGTAGISAISTVEPYFVSGNAGMGALATSNQASGGSPAVANSGCGGGGGAVGYLSAGSPADAGRGGTGGSGKVIISYWGY